MINIHFNLPVSEFKGSQLEVNRTVCSFSIFIRSGLQAEYLPSVSGKHPGGW